jgi:hypothetical protein
MNRPSLYQKTLDILVQAYFNDTLEHANCYACAVGNMIAANCGLKFITAEVTPVGVFTGAGKLFWNFRNQFDNNPLVLMTRGKCDEGANDEQLELALSTGYTLRELALIEEAFEMVAYGLELDVMQSDKVMFDGLMSVIETLDLIHENKDEQVTERSKKLFVKI